MFNWDDLRIFLVAARRGSYQEAGAQAGLDPTTVGRRIARLETALRCTLLARRAGGFALTAAGQRLFETASGIEAATETIGEMLGSEGGHGVVRVSASEGFGTSILAPALPALSVLRPKLAIEMVANPGYYSPATREVDLAITLAPPSDIRLAVEHLTDYRLGLYAAPAYLEAAGSPKTPADLKAHRLVGYIDDLLYAPELRYLDEAHPGLHAQLTSSSIRAQLEIVASGGGIAILPAFLVARAAQPLVPVLPESVRITRSFWISARRDVRETTRVRTVHRWIREAVRRSGNQLLRLDSAGEIEKPILTASTLPDHP
jgi:DNA-binding transcriptional LysR family regulator